MVRGKVFLIVALTFLAIALVIFRTSEQKLKLFCEEPLKGVVVKILEERRISYAFSEPQEADLVVRVNRIVYKGMVYHLEWEERINRRIEELILFYFPGTSIKSSSAGFLSKSYEVAFQDSTHKIELRITGDDVLAGMIESILSQRNNYFENGFLLAPIEVVFDEQKIFTYDPRTEQVFFEKTGGS
ncbi:hypothetical protein AS159_08230 [Thermotoga sp. Ku-13t]|uniref:hypothetical protein n=1 Tax=Thermotoga sp. Ku-13t TaxID=1755813 RepID=UPI0013EA3E40|nr:hypothetical protein [Thermotoga sp. Ku-13t]KAF2957638.1 hypothetical protein AS159_08230 [Thermotoga sp. Ku-13t]